ncbi:MAG: TetR/AcrR family transcriptional regulator [Streptomycetaceae bacterium]|nr:TetR/AcrR family transcriptional regulator [Streptomycetaceae bacterium]
MRATVDLAQEQGYAKLSIEAVAARAGVGKHTIYRRWPSKAMLFRDSLLTLRPPVPDFPDTGDIVADLRRRMHATVDLMAVEPWGPLFRALVGEIQHDPEVAASLAERFFRPQAERTVARLRQAREQGQIAEDLDLDLAQAILAGPVYYRLLISGEPVTHDHVDRLLHTLFAGMAPRPPA